MKNPFPWFAPESGAPPTPAGVVGLAIRVLCYAAIKVGITGVMICYLGRSYFEPFVRAFFLDQQCFRGWGWQFIAWILSFLGGQLKGSARYIYGLCGLPLALSMFLRLFGLRRNGTEGDGKLGGFFCGRLSPGLLARRIGEGLLIVPFLPVFVGALAGFMILLLGVVFLAIHASVRSLRYSGNLYLWMRTVMRGAVRDAFRRWTS
jgi:hypothetical protein